MRSFGITDQKVQAFTFTITNDAGTLKHRIGVAGSSPVTGNSAGRFYDKIIGASTAFTVTPTEEDSNLAAGAKVSPPNAIILDTAEQSPADGIFNASVTYNTSGTSLLVLPCLTSTPVNHTTRTRLWFRLHRSSDGTPFDINTTSIPNGKSISILFNGYLDRRELSKTTTPGAY